MQLIVESSSPFKHVISEGKDGGKKYFLEGIVAQSNKKNRNGRYYPKETLFSRMRDYMREYVERNRAFGELGHPSGPTVNPDRVSHMFTELAEDGDNIWGRAKVMTSLPMGNVVKGFIDEGGQLAMSTRGMGTLKEDPMYGKVVQDDFRLATPGDIVLDPSAHDAFVQGIVEGVEWIMEAGQWVARYRDGFKCKLDQTPRADRDAMVVEAVERFFRSL